MWLWKTRKFVKVSPRAWRSPEGCVLCDEGLRMLWRDKLPQNTEIGDKLVVRAWRMPVPGSREIGIFAGMIRRIDNKPVAFDQQIGLVDSQLKELGATSFYSVYTRWLTVSFINPRLIGASNNSLRDISLLKQHLQPV